LPLRQQYRSSRLRTMAQDLSFIIKAPQQIPGITSTPILRCQDPAHSHVLHCIVTAPVEDHTQDHGFLYTSRTFVPPFLTDVTVPCPPPRPCPPPCSLHIVSQHAFSSSSPPLSSKASLASRWSSLKPSVRGSKSSTTSAPGFPMPELEAELAVETKGR